MTAWELDLTSKLYSREIKQVEQVVFLNSISVTLTNKN